MTPTLWTLKPPAHAPTGISRERDSSIVNQLFDGMEGHMRRGNQERLAGHYTGLWWPLQLVLHNRVAVRVHPWTTSSVHLGRFSELVPLQHATTSVSDRSPVRSSRTTDIAPTWGGTPIHPRAMGRF